MSERLGHSIAQLFRDHLTECNPPSAKEEEESAAAQRPKALCPERHGKEPIPKLKVRLVIPIPRRGNRNPGGR